MFRRPPYPELFVPFEGPADRLTSVLMPDRSNVNVNLGQLALPEYVETTYFEPTINIGALAGLAHDHGIKTVHVLQNTDYDPASKEAFTVSADRETRTIGLYFNEASILRQIMEIFPHLKRDLVAWISCMNAKKLEIKTGINSALRADYFKGAATFRRPMLFFVNRRPVPTINSDDTLTYEQANRLLAMIREQLPDEKPER